MTKLLLSALACFAFVATTSVVFADDANPVPQGADQQEAPRAGDQTQSNEQ